MSRRWPFLLFVVALLTVLVGGGVQLWASLKLQFGEAAADLGGLLRHLLGYLVVLAATGALGWLTYRGPFRRWYMAENPALRWLYWTALLALAAGVYGLLQVRTDHEPEFVDENMLLAALLTLAVVGFAYGADSLRARQERRVLMQQKTEAELRALKAQMNPHFLFNVLNTIYNEALRSGSEPVADLVQQLAGIVRFTVQESPRTHTSLANEVQFLEKYLALQRARLPQLDTLRVETAVDWDEQPGQVAPFLLIPFVENAFQYGISLEQPCTVRVRVCAGEGRLTLVTENTVLPPAAHRTGNGVGIANTRQRLALLYPNRHQLRIRNEDGRFTVELEIRL